MRCKFLLSIIILACTATASFAQTVLTATGYVGYYYAANPGTPPFVYAGGGITFNVVNSNATPITLLDVGYSSYLTNTATLWYSSTSLTGNTGIINASNTAWTLIGTVNVPLATLPTINNTFFAGLNLSIPANTTYRFAVKQDGAAFGGPTIASPSANSVTLDVAGSVYGGDPYGGLLYTGYGFNGSITFISCFPPTGLNVTGIQSTKATVGWNAVTGSTGYDYRVDVNPTYTGGTFKTVTANSDLATGLLPNTTYYLHVRNRCSATNFSDWAHFMFKTGPPCDVPSNFKTPGIASTSTGLSWNVAGGALSYDYIVNQDPADPVGSTGLKNIPTNYDNISGLTEDTKYYIHIRSICAVETSDWMLDSFITPIPCRAPDIKINNVNIDEAVAYWEKINTALHYEYAITTSSTPPAIGTKYMFTSIHTSALNDGKEYFMHVRSYCTSHGITSFSPWSTASFKTFALGVNNVAGDDFSIEAYPNPVINQLQVRLNGHIAGKAAMQVTDMSGKLIRNIAADGKEQQIDMAGMAPGIYMLRYKDDSHNQVIRIIKQ